MCIYAHKCINVYMYAYIYAHVVLPMCMCCKWKRRKSHENTKMCPYGLSKRCLTLSSTHATPLIALWSRYWELHSSIAAWISKHVNIPGSMLKWLVLLSSDTICAICLSICLSASYDFASSDTSPDSTHFNSSVPSGVVVWLWGWIIRKQDYCNEVSETLKTQITYTAEEFKHFSWLSSCCPDYHYV